MNSIALMLLSHLRKVVLINRIDRIGAAGADTDTILDHQRGEALSVDPTDAVLHLCITTVSCSPNQSSRPWIVNVVYDCSVPDPFDCFIDHE